MIWHEACHLAVMDHSPRFWGLLARHVPGLRAAARLAAPQRARRSRCERAAAGRRRRPHRVDPVRGRAAGAGAGRDRARERDLRGRRRRRRGRRGAPREARRHGDVPHGRRRRRPRRPRPATSSSRAASTLHAAVRPARRRAAASPTSTTTTSARSRCSTRGSSRSASDDLPWDLLAGLDAVYFTGGDADALRAARAARVLVATPRALRRHRRERRPARRARVERERPRRAGRRRRARPRPAARRPHRAAPPAARGRARTARRGTWAAEPLPGPPVDSYGSGDAFAAGLTYGLGAGHAGRRGRGARCAPRRPLPDGPRALRGDRPLIQPHGERRADQHDRDDPEAACRRPGAASGHGSPRQRDARRGCRTGDAARSRQRADRVPLGERLQRLRQRARRDERARDERDREDHRRTRRPARPRATSSRCRA